MADPCVLFRETSATSFVGRGSGIVPFGQAAILDRFLRVSLFFSKNWEGSYRAFDSRRQGTNGNAAVVPCTGGRAPAIRTGTVNLLAAQRENPREENGRPSTVRSHDPVFRLPSPKTGGLKPVASRTK